MILTLPLQGEEFSCMLVMDLAASDVLIIYKAIAV
jgi:hypothetical protein